MKTVVLLSGGLDSSTVLAIAVKEGFKPYAISFRYGQRHKVELAAASRIAQSFNVEKHIIVDIDMQKIGGSALTDDINVPKERSEEQMGTGIPITYVPARNTIFLSYALGWAEVLGSSNIHLGVNISLLPTTGMTLPFISYGGSSIISTSLISGIILNLTKREFKFK